MEQKTYGKLDDGREVRLFTLRNGQGASVEIMEYGATVISLTVPDRNGKYEDIILGYDSLVGYVKDQYFIGAIVGRYGNRIAKGKISLEGVEYQLTINNEENHLHGGPVGFNKLLWNGQVVRNDAGPAVKFALVSPDGDQGYPGEVTLSVTYSLTEENELRIEYEGTTNKTTILNPTNHVYFNLTGDARNTILDHELMIEADSITPVNHDLITTGDYMPVKGTPFDFRNPTAIGSHIDADDEQIEFGYGYDHNWVLNNNDGQVRMIASLYDPVSGRLMKVLSDQPGMQFYSGNFLDGSITGKSGINYKLRTALCLETQHYPDSPNKPEFPPVTLKPGDVYRQTTIYAFSVNR